MPLGPDKEPSSQMTKVLIQHIAAAAQYQLSLPEIMKIVADAEWDFSSDPAKVTYKIDEEPHDLEVSIVATAKD